MTYEEYLVNLEAYMEENLQESEYLEEISVVKSNGNKLDGLKYFSDERKDHPVVYANQYYKKEMTEDQNLSFLFLSYYLLIAFLFTYNL